jgi:succinoglycan biosynthesis transport protein ExoP
MELRRYWQIILKRHRTLLWIIGVIVAVAIIGSLITTPVYMFYSNVWIKTSDPKLNIVSSNLPSDLAGLGTIGSDLVMYGQLALIKNLSLIQKVIDEMGLKKKDGQPHSAPEFLNPSSLALISKKIGVKVSVVQTTQLLQIQGFSSSPQEAAEIANRVAAGFVDLYNNNIQTTAKHAYRFIQENLPKVSGRLRQAEEALAEYKVKNHVSNISYFREKLLTSLTNLKDERDSNERELRDSEKRIEQLMAKLKKIPEFRKSSQEYRTNPTLAFLRERLMDMEGNLANTEAKVTPEHLNARQIRASLGKLKEEYKKQVATLFYGESTQRNNYYDLLLQTLGDNEINLAVRTSRQQFLNQQILNRQEELDDLTRKEAAMDPLVRQVSTLASSLSSLMSQEQLARLASEMDLSNATVVERAVVPTLKSHIVKYRWFPKRKLLVIVTFFFSLLLGLAVIFFQEYLDDSLSEPREAEAFLHLPVLASLPKLPEIKAYSLEWVVSHTPWAQAIWALPDMLKPAGQGTLAGTWAITSARAGEGKSLVAASLGWALALRGLRVLLVDLNFSHPTLAMLWQQPPGKGVREVLQGTAALSECVHQVGPGELYLLPNGQAEGIPWAQLDPASLAGWLAAIKTDYEVLLLDLPAVGEGEGAPLAALGEHTLMVVAAHQIPRTQVARGLEQIQRCHSRVEGLVLNRVQKFELWPLVSPVIATVTAWPPVQRLVALIEKGQAKFRLGKRP